MTDPRTAGGQALIDGNPLPQAPERTVNFTLKYDVKSAKNERVKGELNGTIHRVP